MPTPEKRDVSPNLRFVVGSLTNFEQAEDALDDLLKHSLPKDAISILARQDLLSHDARAFGVLDRDAASPSEGDLLTSRGKKILCLGRSLNCALQDRAGHGSKSLKDALQHWLLPRHAGSLSEIVDRGWILIWAEVHTPEEEHAASLSLLRNSRGTVEAHDFIAEPV